MIRAFLLSSALLMISTVSICAENVTMSPENSGVTFIDAQTMGEAFRPYLLPLPDMKKEDQSDAALFEFINQKIKWETDD